MKNTVTNEQVRTVLNRIPKHSIMTRKLLHDDRIDAQVTLVRQTSYYMGTMRRSLEECLTDENVEGWVITLFDCGEVESIKTGEIEDPIELYDILSRWYAVLESCFESRTYSRWLKSTKQVFDEDIMFFTGEIVTGLEAILIILQSIEDEDEYTIVANALLDSGFLS